MAITVGQLLVRLGMDLSDFSKGLQDAQRELRTQGEMFRTAGETLSKAFTLPLVAIGTASVAAFAGFEQGMNKVLALGGKDVADMFEELQKQALQLGADTKYSARQAADAMGELAAAGFKGKEIMAAMPGLLSLAATENMKLADAARIASSVLRGFGIDAAKMGDVADILAQTAAMSAVSIQDLGYSFQYIGPAARAAGQSMMDVSAALAVLGNAGIRGESAGTALRNMLNDLMTPTKAVAEALAALKIKTTDVYGKLLPMGELIKNLTPLTNNMALGFKLFGQRFSDIIPLIADGGEAFRVAQAEIQKFSGAADAMAKTMQKGIAGSLELFTGNLETLAISIGQMLAPMVNVLLQAGSRVIDFVQSVVNAFSKLPVAVQAGVFAFTALVAATGPVLYVLGSLAGAVGNLKLLAPALSGIGTAFKALGLDMAGATSTLANFVKMLAGMTVGSATQSIGGFFANFGKTVKDAFAAIPTTLNSAKGSLVQFGAALATTVAQNAKAAWAALAGFTAEVVKMGVALKNVNVAKTLGGIADAVGAFAGSIKGKGLAGLWDDLLLGFTKFSTLMSGGWAAAMGTAGTGVAALTSELVVGAAAFTGIAAAATAAAVLITRDWEDISRVFKGLVADLEDDTVGFRTALVSLWATLAGGPFVGLIVGTWKYVGQTFKDMWNGIVLAWNTGLQTLANTTADWAASLGFEKMAKALRAYGTEVDVLNARMKQVQTIRIDGISDAEAGVARLNALVAKYTSEVRIGTIAQKEGAQQVQAVGAQIQSLYAQYRKLQNDFKMGLISEEAFEKSKAAIKQAIDGATSFAAQMSGSFGAAGIDVNQFGKTANKTLSDFEKDMRAVEHSADRVKDVLEDLPRSFADFSSKMDNGWKPGKTIESLSEQIRDMGRAMSNETNPKIIAALKEQQKSLMDAQARLIEYQRQWQQDQWVVDANKIVQALQQINLEAAKLELDKSFDADVWKAGLGSLQTMEAQFESVAAAARLLGVELDVTAVKSSGQFRDSVLNANDAVRAYELLARTAGVTSQQMLKAWVGMERQKLIATQTAFNEMSVQADGFVNVLKASWRIGVQEFNIALVEGLQKSQAIMAEAGANLVAALFSFDGGTIIEAVKGFGMRALDALKAAFVEPFQKLFESVLANLSMQVTKFVTDKLMGFLGKAFEGIFGKLGAGLASTAPLQAAATQLQVAATQLQAAATTMAAANGGLKVASEAAGTAAKTAATAAGTVSKSANSVASTASSTMGKIANVTNVVTGAVSAVTGVLSYLQGRRMEQDIARMEVTSREIKAELMNFRADAHVRQEQNFEMTANIVGNIQRYGDSHGSFLSEILGTLQQAVNWLDQIHTKLGTGITTNAGAPTPEAGAGGGESETPGSGAVEGNTEAVEGNTAAVATNTGAVQTNTGGTETNTGAVQTNTGATVESTTATETNALATAQAATATTSLGLAAEVAAGRLPAYAANLESFVGKTSKELAMYVKEAGSSLEQSTTLFNNGTQRVVRDLKTGLQYVVDVATDKVIKIYSAQEKIMDDATGKVVEFGRVVQRTTDYTESMATAAGTVTGELDTLSTSIQQAATRVPVAISALTDSISVASVSINSAAAAITAPSKGLAGDGVVLGSQMPRLAPEVVLNTATPDWGANNGIMLGGRPIPQSFASTTHLTLQVSVNNADARTLGNELVSQWRSQGVDI